MNTVRLQKIDLFRGISVIGMMFFHTNYLFESVFQEDIIPLPDIFWSILGPTVAIMFIFLSGFSYFLSTQKKTVHSILNRALYRFIQLGSIAFLITLVTYNFIPSQKILWGIIHFFALMALVFPIFSRWGQYSIFFGIFTLSIGYLFTDIRVDTDLLIPWGWIPLGFFSADYYPIFPWFGYALIGHGLAYLLDRYDQLGFLEDGGGKIFAPIQYIGRHALWFYLIHVPILYLLLTLVF